MENGHQLDRKRGHMDRSEFMKNLRRYKKSTSAMVGLAMLLVVVIVAAFAPQIAPHDPIQQNIRSSFQPPSAEHWLGTDQYGRDILSRLIFGTRISLTVGILVVVIGAGSGTVIGLIAGWYGGKVDVIISRGFDILLSFPGILLALVILTVLGPSLFNALLALAISSIPRFGRVARGQTLSVRENEYVLASTASGASNWRIMIRHLLPNIAAPLIVLSTLQVGGTILQAATLSFLGLGAQPPTPEWGMMLSSGRDYMREAPWLTTYPGIAIMFSVLAINLFGDGLRDILDPRLRGER